MRKPLTDKDGEVRELALEDMKLFRPIQEVDPGMLEAVENYRRQRGRPPVEHPKEQITLRLDADVVAGMRATGRNYNAWANEVLRKALVER
jgi:uncharacterized protein (DUF4415 family)